MTSVEAPAAPPPSSAPFATRPPPPPSKATSLYWFLGILGTCAIVGGTAFGLYAKDHWRDLLADALSIGASSKPGPYPKEYVSRFTEGCIKGAEKGDLKGHGRAYCQCFIDEAERSLSYRDFLRKAMEPKKDGESPPELKRIVQRCVQPDIIGSDAQNSEHVEAE